MSGARCLFQKWNRHEGALSWTYTAGYLAYLIVAGIKTWPTTTWSAWWWSQTWRCRQHGMPRSGPTTSQGSLAFGSQLLDRRRKSAQLGVNGAHDASVLTTSATKTPNRCRLVGSTFDGFTTPASAGLFFARPVKFPRLLPNLVLESAKEAGGLRHTPPAGELVRQVTDIHFGPGTRFCVHRPDRRKNRGLHRGNPAHGDERGAALGTARGGDHWSPPRTPIVPPPATHSSHYWVIKAARRQSTW